MKMIRHLVVRAALCGLCGAMGSIVISEMGGPYVFWLGYVVAVLFWGVAAIVENEIHYGKSCQDAGSARGLGGGDG